jgi:hypothetical protein
MWYNVPCMTKTEKEKAKVVSLFGDLENKKFSIGKYSFEVKVPTIFDEAKVVFKRYDIFKKLIDNDKDFKDYVSRYKVTTVKDGEIVGTDPDFDKQSHLEEVFSQIDPRLQELFSRVALLDVITEAVYYNDERLDVKPSDLLSVGATKVHLVDFTRLVDQIYDWLNTIDLDPFFREKVN